MLLPATLVSCSCSVHDRCGAPSCPALTPPSVWRASSTRCARRSPPTASGACSRCRCCSCCGRGLAAWPSGHGASPAASPPARRSRPHATRAPAPAAPTRPYIRLPRGFAWLVRAVPGTAAARRSCSSCWPIRRWRPWSRPRRCAGCCARCAGCSVSTPPPATKPAPGDAAGPSRPIPEEANHRTRRPNRCLAGPPPRGPPAPPPPPSRKMPPERQRLVTPVSLRYQLRSRDAANLRPASGANPPPALQPFRLAGHDARQRRRAARGGNNGRQARRQDGILHRRGTGHRPRDRARVRRRGRNRGRHRPQRATRWPKSPGRRSAPSR